MPKVILEYNLPEENEEYEYAMNGVKYSIIVDEIFNKLRSLQKYENKNTININKFRDFILNLQKDLGIT